MPNDDIHEQLREKYYRKGEDEGIEREQKRLNNIFAILGDINKENSSIIFLPYEFETLDKVRSSVESGDRKAMLALLVIMADALHAFEVLPKDVRESLADGLEKMLINLRESHDFLPIGRGKSSERKEGEQSSKAYWTALSVESHRFSDGCSLEDAIAKVSEEKDLTESLVQKRWKKKHKDAKTTLKIMSSVLKQPRKEVVSRPRRKR